MNIFYLSENPQLCARYHCDKHVVKMILETAQLLSTAHHVMGSSIADRLYRPTHINHPCSVWVRQSALNYQWLAQLGLSLLQEYRLRYGKNHKCTEILNLLADVFPPMDKFPQSIATPPALAMPAQYQTSHAVTSYRQYYIGEKARFATWKNGDTPEWFK